MTEAHKESKSGEVEDVAVGQFCFGDVQGEASDFVRDACMAIPRKPKLVCMKRRSRRILQTPVLVRSSVASIPAGPATTE